MSLYVHITTCIRDSLYAKPIELTSAPIQRVELLVLHHKNFSSSGGVL